MCLGVLSRYIVTTIVNIGRFRGPSRYKGVTGALQGVTNGKGDPPSSTSFASLLRQKHYRGRESAPEGGKALPPPQAMEGGMEGGGIGQRSSPGRGVFKRDKRDKRDKSIKTGFFAFWKRDK